MTFDDGPHPTFTARLLDIAAERAIKLTFFVVGERVAKYPEILHRQVVDGHEIGNHSWSHANLAALSDDDVKSELRRTDDIVASATGVRPTLLRPPYGELTRNQRQLVRNLGYQLIFWNIDSMDWRQRGSAAIARTVLTKTGPKSIVLAHDTYTGTIDAMSEIFDTLLKLGMRFVTVGQLGAGVNGKGALVTLVHHEN